MKLKRTNKLLALLLAVLMVMSLLPGMALAEENTISITIDLSGYTGQVALFQIVSGIPAQVKERYKPRRLIHLRLDQI